MAEFSFYSLFSVAPYPCLVCDENWVVIYKNRPAVRYLHLIRKASRLDKRIRDPESLSVLKGGKPLLIFIPTDAIYHRAVGFSFENEGKRCFIFLFLSRIQLSDGEKTAKMITDSFSSDFFDFYTRLKQIEYKVDAPFDPPERLYEDMVSRFCLLSFREFEQTCTCNMADYLHHIKEKASRSLAVLGYRLTFEQTEKFYANRFAFIDLNDFSFLFFRALYALFSHSENGIVDIKADFDELTASILLTMQTPSPGENREEITISELLPECLLETKLLMPVLGKDKLFSFNRNDGRLCAAGRLRRYSFYRPYYVQSESKAPSFTSLDILTHNLYMLLKEEKKRSDDRNEVT